MSDEALRDKVARLPTVPGVYLFKDARGRTIYVGKANSIRDRVRSHLTSSPDQGKQERMLAEAADVEIIMTDSELEALTLENSLIKQNRPKFNVLLRDDKTYPYLKLTHSERFPRLPLVRGVQPDADAYFGPYIPASTARLTQVLAYRHFGVRPCNIDIDGSWDRPCLYYDIGECAGPCVQALCSETRYREVVDETRLFLEGRGEDLERDLEVKMSDAAAAQEYERAAHYRDLLGTLQATAREQKMASTDLEDRDLFAFYRQQERVAMQVFLVRRGLVVERKQFFWDNLSGVANDELLSTAVQQYYHGEAALPPEVCVPLPLPDAKTLQAWLRQRRGGRLKFFVPQRGAKKRLLDLATNNARLAFADRYETSVSAEGSQALAELLRLDGPPRVVECVDVSNLQGRQIVASLVCFRDGKPDKRGYKRFKIRGLDRQDDFGSITQVVARHFRRIRTGERQPPDLLVIDGGRGQLGAAARGLQQAEMQHQPLAALEKGEEKLYLLGRVAPISTATCPAARRLLQRVRDEAHRFAVEYHRSLRRKDLLGSELQEIVGVGPSRRRRLLRQFGSLAGVRDASEAELAEVVGVKLAERITSHFS